MRIGFIGDIHGRVFHVLGAALAWQWALGARFNLIVQVGDFGAFPDPSTFDAPTARYVREDPSEQDFSRLLLATGDLAERLKAVKRQLLRPIHFIRGDHEDFAWLNERLAGSKTIDVDPFGLFRYVADGAVLNLDGTRLAFLGGSDTDKVGPAINREAYEALLHLEPRSVDVLVTHDAPWGVSTGYQGQIQGSRRISALVEALEPRHHIAGHYHHLIGPRKFGRTTYLGLACLLHAPSRDPSRQVPSGAFVLLDTEEAEARFVTDRWVDGISGSFNFKRLTDQLGYLQWAFTEAT
ncbi:MAG: metallophosphoesterase family protein [Actinomycetota bacterium]